MGYNNAAGMKSSVDEGLITIEAALEYHLTVNHYPPLPKALVGVAKQAIIEANKGNYHAELALPLGLQFRNHDTISVGDALESLHLDAFVEPN